MRKIILSNYWKNLLLADYFFILDIVFMYYNIVNFPKGVMVWVVLGIGFVVLFTGFWFLRLAFKEGVFYK